MPKMKTKKSAAKRFKRTGSGKLIHQSPAQNHLTRTKNAVRMRRLKSDKTLERGDEKVIEKLLPYD